MVLTPVVAVGNRAIKEAKALAQRLITLKALASLVRAAFNESLDATSPRSKDRTQHSALPAREYSMTRARG